MKRTSILLLILFAFLTFDSFSQALNWEELGPKNNGGRTRAILIDKRDASRSTIYAGMVSGGLWKSTDHGNSWNPILSAYTCAAVTCIAQDANGRIYFGTGEGLAQPSGSSRNSGSVGNGLHFLYGNDQDSILPSTIPAYLTSASTWSLINRIAINPTNANEIFVATSGYSGSSGLMRSMDGGQTWTLIGSASVPISGLASNYTTAADVKYSSDGNNVFASVGLASGVFPGGKLIVSTDGGNTFTYVTSDSLPANLTRIEIAVAPSDPQTVYISVADGTGRFAGVWQSPDAGATWTQIGALAGVLNNVFGTDGQGWYDNAIAVNPNQSGMVYLGGVALYSYSSLTGWTLANIQSGGASNPYWLGKDIQTIVFNDKDSNEMYIGSDAGIFRSTNAGSSFPTPTYEVRNQGYNTVEMYSVASDLYGNVLGGTQNDGTMLANINQSAVQVYPGISGYAEISHFDSSVFIGGYVGGYEYRSYDRGGNTWNSLFDGVIDPRGYGDPSVCGQPQGSNAPFVTALWLAETKNATNSISRVPFVDNVAHNAGDIVTIRSHIGQTFQDALSAALPAGDTAYFTDRLQSRLYFAINCGLWMTPDILDSLHIPRWFRITALSDDVKALAASPTGDTIYISGNARVTRISGLNSVQFDTFSVGQNSIIMNAYPAFQQVPIQVTTSGQYIEGLDVDIHDPNHVICAVAGFSTPGTPHVYVSTDAGSTWTAIHNNLPDMPIYQCVIDAYDPTHYILGTEMGFWDSHDGGTTWTEQNGGIVVREPVYRLRQQTYLSDQCYALYAGTHGRGMWRSTTITAAQAGCTVVPLGISEPGTAQQADHMQLYPNPMNGNGTVMIALREASDMTLQVVDMTGRVLQSSSYTNLKAGENTLDLNTSSLANGAYLVVARQANGPSYTRTLVVAR